MKKYFKLLANIITIGCVIIALAACNKYTPADDPYELPDPVEPDIAYSYSIEVSSPYAWTADGQNFTPVVGSQLNKITVSAEGTPVAYFEIVTEENPTTLAGTYPVKAVNSLERAIVQGQFMNLLWLGMFDMAIESGSYYLNGETKMFIRDGNITVTDNSGALTITGSSLGIQDISTEMNFGSLPDLGKVNYPNMTLTVSHNYTYTKTVTTPYQFTTDGQNYTPVPGSQLNTITVSDNNVLCAIFDVVTEENPTTLAGTYPVKAVNSLERAIVQGVYMDMTSWMSIPGIPIIEVPSYYLDGDTKMFIREGNITITDNAGVLTITGNGLGIQDISTQMNFGNLSTPGSVNYSTITLVGNQPPGEDPIIGNYAAPLTYGSTVTTPAVYTNAQQQPVEIDGSQLNVIEVISGGTVVVKLELVTTESATSLAGDYAMKDGTAGAVAIGDALTGFYLDLSFMEMGIITGGCYFMANGETQYIRPGSTIHVEDNAGTLTITGSGLLIQDISTGMAFGNKTAHGIFTLTNVTPE
ncbi:MAG: hypothetical protein LBM08_04580 [Dysgonamonadaceae bacterium]|jgi:hypothetical protein|nr:hypothetical protein [Dysgonamonadaceae bacterium]